ncbi:MAG TPA: anthranilate phosphoribosyltransferase [Candidatus Acidoferrum sp.]|jgi:anthranilate phosphoribosyltransferase|nr:anthranilate phosphoribosyltransferase [Candidatus Acidoferrum sp.]
MILDALHHVANHGQSLERAEARGVMAEVLAGNCTDAQIAALLVALRMKGETVEEIVGFAEAIRAAAIPLPISVAGDASASGALDLSGTGRDALAESSLIDTSGTGGDACGTFNISTATAFVTAGAGVRVAKHGNRSISSKCGSADVMEALGVKIQLAPERAAQCLREIGICFLYAPDLHSSMKQVQKVRRELHLRTMFNLLGPLTNPARASGQVVGVYALEMVEKVAEALSMLGLRRALVVHGLDGLDEITITGPTRVAEARDGIVRTYEVDPEEFGMKRATLADIAGGDAAENAAIVREVLSGTKSPRRDVVLLNSAAALVAAGRVHHLADGIPLAAQSIDSGAAAAKLAALARCANALLS